MMSLAMSTESILAGAAVVAAGAAIAGVFVAYGGTRRSVEALDMPFIVAFAQRPGAWVTTYGGHGSKLGFLFWNIGKGPAIIRDVRLTVNGVDALPAGQHDVPLAAGERQELKLWVESDPPYKPQQGVLRIYYSHASGTLYMTRSQVSFNNEGLLCMDFERAKGDGDDRDPER
jgi:hypothetical protein